MARRESRQPAVGDVVRAVLWTTVIVLVLVVALPQHASAQSSSAEILPPKPAPAAKSASPSSALRPTVDDDAAQAEETPVLRPAARDGDLSQPTDPPIRDGFFDLNGMLATPDVDGIDTEKIDARPASEAAQFELPRNGQLFQVEDVVPFRDRRVPGLYFAEPYYPVGYKVGSFVLFPQVELAGVAYSNVARVPQAKSDIALEMRPEMRLVSDWRWHALELRATGNLTFHEEHATEDDRGSALEARGRIDLDRRTNVQALVSREVSQESRFGVNATTAIDRPDITTTQVQASVNHRFNRLSIQLRGGVAETEAASFKDDTGAVVPQPERHYTETNEAVRVRYDLRSSFGLFSDTTLVQRQYEAAPSDGLKRDSTGERYRFGLLFQPDGTRLRGEASLGWGRQNPDSPTLTTVDGLLLDANLVWRMTPLTSLLLTARSDIVDSVNDHVGGVLSRTAGIEARHLLRRYLIASAGLQLTRYDYHGNDLAERATTARLGLEYALSREVQLFTRYDHVWFDSTAAGADWQADEVRVGMRVRH